jgi:hypothetical protein
MNSIDWQNVAALSLATGAGLYLLRRAWRLFSAKGAGSCGGCPKCPGDSAAGPAGDKPFVAIDEITRPAADANVPSTKQ